MQRKAQVERKTKETDITLFLNLDSSNESKIATGVGFFDHMLQAFAKHSGFELQVQAKGDLHIDGHHTVEDVGIVLGSAFYKAVKEIKEIARFGHAYCPLDEALARAVVDISGRPFFRFVCSLPLTRVGEFDAELYQEFLRAFAMNAQITLHVELLNGENQHHAMEAMTKALARALKIAVQVQEHESGAPSTKGVLI